MRAVLVLAIAIAVAGCPVGGGECTLDSDCVGGDVCANTHDCRAAGAVTRLVIRWTLWGAPADASNCAGLGDLEITIRDREEPANVASWSPVPCAAGRFTFDKLPVEYDRCEIHAPRTGESHEDVIPAGGGELTFDMTSGSVPVDAGVVDAAY